MKPSRIFVAGHRGMVGSALVRRLARENCRDIDGLAQRGRSARCRRASSAFLQREKPDAIILAAAKVGGILANDTYPAEFLATISSSRRTVIHEAHRAGIDRLCLPWLVLHLSEICAAADQRGCAADRPAGADQRMVCDRQDRRHQALPGLSPAIWPPLHLGHAVQSLRAERQFRSRDEPCAAGADPQVP